MSSTGKRSDVWGQARRLAQTFPDSKIVILVREQTSFLESFYCHQLRFGYGFSPERFIRSYCPSNNVFHGLAYDRVAAEYRQLFDHVHVTPMERLVGSRADPEALDSLFDFIGVPTPQVDVAAATNMRLTAPAVRLTRLLNRLTGTKLQMFDEARLYNAWRYRWSRRLDRLARRRGAAAEFKFSPEIREEIRQHFAASNSNLEALLGVGIAQYGYTTA